MGGYEAPVQQEFTLMQSVISPRSERIFRDELVKGEGGSLFLRTKRNDLGGSASMRGTVMFCSPAMTSGFQRIRAFAGLA